MTFLAAVVQDSPILFDLHSTIEKVDKITKKAAEKTEGGLRDVRLSTRPDLLPQATFQGFDVGVRPGMFYGGRMDEQELDMRMGGPSVGPGTETSDDIPAMLSDGEFVMTGQAVRGAGTYEMKSEPGGIISLVPSLEENRERGMDLMYQMMDTFASQAKVN